jgi:2-amino-4-hydroxy-6-hydroxymethyldihydropteridine diphosphokinase
LNGTARPDQEANILYLAMGSNINPHKNIPLALQRLKTCCDVLNISSVWETHAEGSAGQNFLNLVLCVSTSEDLESFKLQELRRIETELQRVRSSDKNAPRTMDIDILIFNGMVFGIKYSLLFPSPK